MFKWLFIISDNCLPVAVQNVSSSEPVESKSLVLTFGDLLDVLETVAAVPTQRDLRYEPKKMRLNQNNYHTMHYNDFDALSK